jgi:hypothetical protein
MTSRLAMGAARIATGKILLIQYGPTMTLDQFKAAFMPSVVTKTIRNKVSSGDLPPLRGEVFDTQEIGDWWDALCTATVPKAA